jgi:hypothetical protein
VRGRAARAGRGGGVRLVVVVTAGAGAAWAAPADCMPCSMVSSDHVALGLVAAVQSGSI